MTALELIAKEKKEKTGKLDLGRCGLTELPDELFELENLEELIVSNEYVDYNQGVKIFKEKGISNNLSYIPKKIDQLKKLKVLHLGGDKKTKWEISDLNPLANLQNIQILDLSNNQISDLKPIKELKNLRVLSLADNKIAKADMIGLLENLSYLNLNANNIGDARFLENLINLTILLMAGNNIKEINNIEKLSKLQTLNLNNNQINNISFSEDLSLLQSLYLSSNNINDIIFLKDLTSIQSLDLRYNQIRNISALRNFTNLQSLDLRYNQIRNISTLKNLWNLLSLYLSYNHISDIGILRNLTNIQTLYLSENQISDISVLKHLTNLQSLFFSENQIKDVSVLGNLKNLHTLHLISNQISDISFLRNLADIRTLNLSKNQISDISILENHMNLQSLNLRYNQINDITPLKNLIIYRDQDINLGWKPNGIILGGNPLTVPPHEIVKKGREAVINWYEQIKKESINLHESKILIVGQGEVGKTWLLYKIITGKTPKKGETTEGIDIKHWTLNTEKIKDFKINFWDFGGQEIYHATHQFFLSKRSLYIFVWDARKDEDRITSFDYWLNVISLLSNNSPIIIVMNKCDERTKAIGHETLKMKFPNILSFHEVSALTGKNIEILKEDIRKHIIQLPHVGDELPKVWEDIRYELENLGEHCIKNVDYKAICKKHGQNMKEADFLSDYYHDLGVFLHFRDNIILNDIVFINPEWATNAVYRIIDTKEVIRNYGKFQYIQLKDIWKEYDEDKFKYLIELMKRFELCFQLGNTTTYIVPELLSPEFPELDWDYNDNLRFEFSYSFMPAGIITRFIARQHKLIKDDIYWRFGVVLKRNSTKALIVSEPLSRKVRIWLNGEESKEFLFMIRTEISNIHESLNNPEVNEMYPCNCDECIVTVSPYFYDSDMLTRFRIKKITSVQCQKSGLQVDIEKLCTKMLLNEDIAIEKILEVTSKSEEMLNEVIELLHTIASNQPEKDTALDDFFKIVKLDLGIINFGEVLKRVLKYKKRSFI